MDCRCWAAPASNPRQEAATFAHTKGVLPSCAPFGRHGLDWGDAPGDVQELSLLARWELAGRANLANVNAEEGRAVRHDRPERRLGHGVARLVLLGEMHFPPLADGVVQRER